MDNMNAQDIREKAFKAARFNGYAIDEVDAFMDDVADEMERLAKENASLKAKCKVLADSVQGYRSNEEAVNLSILSAQKLAVQIETDARTRAAALLEDANRRSAEKIGAIAEDAAAEEKHLAAAKESAAKFLADMKAKLADEISAIEAIIAGSELPAVEAPAAKAPAAPVSEPVEVDEAVRSIEESVSRIQPGPSFKLDLSDAMEAPAVKSDNGFSSTQQFSF